MGHKITEATETVLTDEAGNQISPFLKWPGGKRWLVYSHSNIFPQKFNRYIEPFLGSAAVFFYLQPTKALLGDSNKELVDLYLALKTNWRQVVAYLNEHDESHGKKYYYEIRDEAPTGRLQRAARTLYLNRTCFNGIYRVNRNGIFNVPKGDKNAVILPADDFRAVSELLQSAEIYCSDFENLVNKAQTGDLIFADPPYTVRHNFNGFIKYNETLFSWNDQIRLADALQRAKLRGAQIVSTNANHKSVRSLYRERGFSLSSVSRYSSISATVESRKQFEELLIVN